MEGYLSQPRYRGEDVGSTSSDVIDFFDPPPHMGSLTISEEWGRRVGRREGEWEVRRKTWTGM